jgi:Transposase DDE domain group 1
MKVAVGRCPQTGAPLASQSTISCLENEPSKTEAARLSAALLDQFGVTVKPGRMEILDIDDTFCAAHGGQQLAFWNAREDERGFGASCPAEPPTMADQSQTRCMASRLAPIQLLGSRGRAFAAEVQKCAAWCMIRVSPDFSNN